MANSRKEAHQRYTSFAIIDDFRGRVVNIEDSFCNLPHLIYLPMQCINESMTMEEWSMLIGRTGVECLNHTMLLTYKVSIAFSSTSLRRTTSHKAN